MPTLPTDEGITLMELLSSMGKLAGGGSGDIFRDCGALVAPRRATVCRRFELGGVARRNQGQSYLQLIIMDDDLSPPKQLRKSSAKLCRRRLAVVS
jgi:hypothetical protein